jgi:hypothetical protein
MNESGPVASREAAVAGSRSLDSAALDDAGRLEGLPRRAPVSGEICRLGAGAQDHPERAQLNLVSQALRTRTAVP